MPLTIGGRREGKGAGEGTRGQERGQGGRIGNKVPFWSQYNRT